MALMIVGKVLECSGSEWLERITHHFLCSLCFLSATLWLTVNKGKKMNMTIKKKDSVKSEQRQVFG